MRAMTATYTFTVSPEFETTVLRIECVLTTCLHSRVLQSEPLIGASFPSQSWKNVASLNCFLPLCVVAEIASVLLLVCYLDNAIKEQVSNVFLLFSGNLIKSPPCSAESGRLRKVAAVLYSWALLDCPVCPRLCICAQSPPRFTHMYMTCV